MYAAGCGSSVGYEVRMAQAKEHPKGGGRVIEKEGSGGVGGDSMKQLSFSYTALSKLLRRRLTTIDGSRAAHIARRLELLFAFTVG